MFSAVYSYLFYKIQIKKILKENKNVDLKKRLIS